jgi:peptidoglycan/LPS O-acetylase OafA/YrhL
MMNKLKVFEVLKTKDRISSIDIFRFFAITAVVIFHFNKKLPFGFLGVDLFFVISGLLVSNILTKEIKNENKINFFKFFIQRGFKIWPSYYYFLVVGNLIAYIIYRNSNTQEIIPISDLKRYLLFYQNYTGTPFHWSFDHVWSLCVEEHFYIFLPIFFILLQKFFIKNQIFWVFTFVLLTILLGVFFKYYSYYYTNSHDTYSATHNRIDALGWGVLLNLIFNYSKKVKELKLIYFFVSGVLLFMLLIYLNISLNNEIFNKIYFHSLVPFAFFLMLLGLYFYDFSNLKFIRFVAYFSYNWYLWHPIFAIYFTNTFGDSFISLIFYLVFTFIISIFTTIFVEEKILKQRSKFIEKYFKN